MWQHLTKDYYYRREGAIDHARNRAKCRMARDWQWKRLQNMANKANSLNREQVKKMVEEMKDEQKATWNNATAGGLA